MVRPCWEVADVLGLCAEQIQEDRQLPQMVKRVARALLQCRTAALGGHAMRCNQWGHQEISYNSCRNLHCPKCQYSKREQWALDRERDVLLVKNYHIVFTLPSELHTVAKAEIGDLRRFTSFKKQGKEPRSGDRDPFFPVDIPITSYKSIPNSYLWIVPNFGHRGFDNAPMWADTFTNVVLQFLSGEWSD